MNDHDQPPHNIAAEQRVLGGMILSAAAVSDVSEILKPQDHYKPAHQLIHETILHLYDKDEPTDTVAVAAELARRGDLTKVGDADYLHTLIASVPAAVNAGYYARIVAGLAERRQWIEHATRIAQAASDPEVELDTVRHLATQQPDASDEGRTRPARRLVLTPASEIDPEPVIWGWEDSGNGRIPAGSLGLAAGREGTGKSSYAVWLAARITTGSLPGSFEGRSRAVIYVAVEDSWRFTIVPRLMAAGADLAQVFRAEVETIEGETVTLNLPADNKLLTEAISNNEVALVVLDPLMSAISDTLDTHVNRQVRQALDPLARIADQSGAMLLGIAHFNKSGGTDASSLVTGSGAFKDVARYLFAFATDPQDGAQVITQTKNSLGLSNLPSLAYRIVEAVVPTGKGDARVGRFVLDGETDKNVTEILTALNSAPSERDEKSRAEEYLRKALASGPRRTKEVEEDAREIHSISPRTLDRARTSLKILATKRDSGPFGRDEKRKAEWWIALPEHEQELKEPYKPPKSETPLPAETETDASKDAKSANSASPGGVGALGVLGSPGGSTGTSPDGCDP